MSGQKSPLHSKVSEFQRGTTAGIKLSVMHLEGNGDTYNIEDSRSPRTCITKLILAYAYLIKVLGALKKDS